MSGASFQSQVEPWLLACFGEEIATDREERNHRFLEEALELVQANGCTASEAHQLVDYVFGRPVGDPAQEVGGVMVTLAALCRAIGIDMHAAGETELARIWTKVEAIRAKQAAKPKHSPLPEAIPARRWQSLDTAPDMRVVLLHHEYYSHGRVRLGYYGRRGWVGVNADGTEGPLQFEPTHWQDLPAPTVAGEQTDEAL